MPAWSRVADVAQLASVDAYGLIKMITQRVEKVRRNKYDCQQLAQHVGTIEGLLQQVHTQNRAVDGLLKNLEATLREACLLVSSCQASSYLRRFFRSGRHAEQFQRIKHRIDFYIQIFPVISHIDTTRRLVRIIESIESPQTQVISMDQLKIIFCSFTVVSQTACMNAENAADLVRSSRSCTLVSLLTCLLQIVNNIFLHFPSINVYVSR